MDISRLAMDTILSFFPDTRLLTGLRRLSLFATTWFPLVAIDRYVPGGYCKGFQPLPPKLEHGFQILNDQLLMGGLERCIIARELRDDEWGSGRTELMNNYRDWLVSYTKRAADLPDCGVVV